MCSFFNQHLQEAELLLRVQGVSLVHSSHHNATIVHSAFLSLVIRYVWDFLNKHMATDACESTRIAPTVCNRLVKTKHRGQ